MEDLKNGQKRLIFKLRTRMAEYGGNFKGGREKVMCPYCHLHLDSQDISYKCPVIKEEVKVIGESEIKDIYSSHVKLETVETLEKIEEYRKMRKDENK